MEKARGCRPEAIKKVSSAAGALCIWVHAIYIYGNVAKEVAPKKARLKKAEKSLAVKQEALAVAKAALVEKFHAPARMVKSAPEAMSRNSSRLKCCCKCLDLGNTAAVLSCP